MAIHSRILAWKIPWTEEPGGLQSIGSQESDMAEHACTRDEHMTIYLLSTHIESKTNTNYKESWIFWLTIKKVDYDYIWWKRLSLYGEENKNGLAKSHIVFVLAEIGLQTTSLSLYYVLSSISRIKNYSFSPPHLTFRITIFLNVLPTM